MIGSALYALPDTIRVTSPGITVPLVLRVFRRFLGTNVIARLKKLENFVKLVRLRKKVLTHLNLKVPEQNLTDVSFTGKRSFLSLGPIEVEPTRFNIEFQLRPLTNRGVVLFIGSQTSFLCLLLHNSFLELTLLAGSMRLFLQTITNHCTIKCFQ